jgi:hypothetical protein
MVLFKSKAKKNTVQQDAELPVNRPPRYSSWADVGISGFEGKALLRNISVGGFCMESRTYAALKPGDNCTMRVIPESSSGIKPFDMQVEVRWVHCTEQVFRSGFALSAAHRERAFEKYIDYIKSNPA